MKLKFENGEKQTNDDVTPLREAEHEAEEGDDVTPMAQNEESESETVSKEDSKAKPKPGSQVREEANIFQPAVGTLPHQPKSDRHAPPQNISVKKSTAPLPPSSTSQPTSSVLPSNSGDAKPQAIVKPTPQKPAQQTNNNLPTRDDDVIKMETEKRRAASETGSLDSTPSNATTSTLPAGGTLSDLKRHRAQALQEKLSNSLRFKDTEQLNAQLQQLQVEHDEAQARNERTSSASDSSRPHSDVGVGVRSGSANARRYKFSQPTVVGETDDSSGCCVVQ